VTVALAAAVEVYIVQNAIDLARVLGIVRARLRRRMRTPRVPRGRLGGGIRHEGKGSHTVDPLKLVSRLIDTGNVDTVYRDVYLRRRGGCDRGVPHRKRTPARTR
jgi:hypothetical protein